MSCSWPKKHTLHAWWKHRWLRLLLGAGVACGAPGSPPGQQDSCQRPMPVPLWRRQSCSHSDLRPVCWGLTLPRHPTVLLCCCPAVVRYHKGEFYHEHYDNRADGPLTRAATILVYLCGTEEGGATRWAAAGL